MKYEIRVTSPVVSNSMKHSNEIFTDLDECFDECRVWTKVALSEGSENIYFPSPVSDEEE